MGISDQFDDRSPREQDEARRRMGRETEQEAERSGRPDRDEQGMRGRQRSAEESPERDRAIEDEDTLEQQWSQGEDPF